MTLQYQNENFADEIARAREMGFEIKANAHLARWIDWRPIHGVTGWRSHPTEDAFKLMEQETADA